MIHPCVSHDSSLCVTWLSCCTARKEALPSFFVCVARLIRMCATWLIHMCDMTQVLRRARVSVALFCFIRVAWFMRMRDMTESYLCHDSSVFVTWLRHICDMTQVQHRAHVSVAVLFRMCGMTHTHVWQDWCDMTHPYIWHMTWLRCCITREQALPSFVSYVCYDLFVCVSWLMCMCDVTHQYMWHDSGAASRARKRRPPTSRLLSGELHVSASTMSLSMSVCERECAKTHRCLIWQVIYRKRATNCRALLRKITYTNMASYRSSPPCTVHILQFSLSRSKDALLCVIWHMYGGPDSLMMYERSY